MIQYKVQTFDRRTGNLHPAFCAESYDSSTEINVRDTFAMVDKGNDYHLYGQLKVVHKIVRGYDDNDILICVIG